MSGKGFLYSSERVDIKIEVILHRPSKTFMDLLLPSMPKNTQHQRTKIVQVVEP